MAQLAAQGPINGPGFAIYHPPRAPDFWKWDDRQVFTLGQVAALWLNQEPENLPLRAPVSEVFWRLYGDIYAGRLKPKLNIDESLSLASAQVGGYPTSGEDPITVETKIGREEIRRYALASKDRPMFLFKDARAGKKPNP